MVAAPLDLLIIGLYLAAMTAIGLYYRRSANAGMQQFFLAGRRVPGWVNGVSYAAALISADAATAYGGLAVVTGLFVCWWYLSRFGLALFIGAVLFAVFWRKLNLFTSLEFYELRFRGKPAALMRLWIALRTSGLAMPAWTGITLLLLVSLPCLAAPVLWPELAQPGADRELAYGRLMKALLPAGLMGLVVAAMLAGVMSTVSDNLNFGGQVMTHDLYARWIRPGASEQHYLRAGKVAMGVILALALAVVYNVRIIFDVAVFMLQLSAAELPANWAQWWWWRFNGKARLAASFGGAAIFCLVVLGPRLLVWLGVAGAQSLILPYWWQTFLVIGATTVLWVTVALCTRPEDEQLLRDFYQRARPMGWWGPIAEKAS